tara:strand:+ start:3031 stop:12057 length:9027 start_codon:yes stop_codon:yes gene_type:complete
MSNNSWKQYGGISRMEEFNVINANTVVAEQFVSRSTRPIYQYLNGTFEVSGDLSAANNIITSTNFYCKSDITVDRNLYANEKLFFGSGKFEPITPDLPNDSTHAYLYGDASFVGVNIKQPNTIFHITSNVPEETNILTVESSNNYIRNILAQNKNDKGVVLDADDNSANIFFHVDSSTDKFNVSDANITYSIGGNLSSYSNYNNLYALENITLNSSGGYLLDTSGTTTFIDRNNANIRTDLSGNYDIHSSGNYTLTTKGSVEIHASGGFIEVDSSGGEIQMNSHQTNIQSYVNIAVPERGMSDELYGETLTVYDSSNVSFLPNVYDISRVLTGNTIVGVAKDASANTFMRLVTGEGLLGSAYGGGVFPNDTSRSVNMIGLNDANGNYVNNQIIINNNRKDKYMSSVGFNTFEPKSDQYTVDINGPVRISNGEIQTLEEINFEINSIYFSKTHPNHGIGIGTPSTLIDSNTNPQYDQFAVFTNDKGINWHISEKVYGNSDLNQTNVPFNSAYLYDSTYGFIVGEKSYAYYTNNGGLNWYRITFGDLLFRDQMTIVGGTYDNKLRLFIPYKYNNVATNQVDSATNQIRYFDIQIPNLSSTLNGQIYPIGSNEISLNINVKCSTFTASKVIFAGNGIAVFNINLIGSPYYFYQSNIYHDVYAIDNDTIIAVGNDVISYSQDGGINWSSFNISTETSMANNKYNISNIVLKSIHARNNKIVVVGEEGIFGYSDNGPAKENWKIVPDAMLNSSGISERINGKKNELMNVYMKDDESILITKIAEKQFNDVIDNSKDRPGLTKILHVFIPPLFNRLQNKILDICGNINIVGDMDILDGDLSVTNRLFANYIDSNDDGTFPNNKNLSIGENTQIINIGAVMPDSRKTGEYYIRDDSSYNFINIGAVQPDTDAKPYYIQMGNYLGTKNPDISQNKIVIGGATDDLVFGGGGFAIKSEAELLVTNKIVRVNNDTSNPNSSAESGLYIYERYSDAVNDTDPDAGFVRISDDRKGFNFKSTINNSHIVTLETEDMSLNFANPYNTEYGINDVQNGLLVLTKSQPETGGDYSITVKPVDLSNVFIRDSQTSTEEMQSILTKVSFNDNLLLNSRFYVQDKSFLNNDVFMNSRLFVEQDVSLNKRLFVQETTILNEDVSLNMRLFVEKDVSLNSRFYVKENTILDGDVSINQNLFVGKDLTIDGNLFVEQYKNETIINTTTTNYSLIVAEDLSLNGRMFVRDESYFEKDVSFNSKLYVADKIGVNIHDPTVSLDISTNDAMKLPTGTDAQRPVLNNDYYEGFIRFNNNLFYSETGAGDYAYEGSFGPDTWKPLGQHWKGVIDTDGDTYITAENSYGEDNDDLKFYTSNELRMTISQDGNFGFNSAPNSDISFNIHGYTNVDGSLNVTGFLTQDNVAVLNGTGSSVSVNARILGNHSGDDGMYIGYNQTSDNADIRFYTNDNLPKMVIKTSGDVSMNGNVTIEGDVSMNSDLYVTKLQSRTGTTINLGNHTISYKRLTDVPTEAANIESVPVGGIIMWTNPDNIPIGFYICDGGQYTPGVNPATGYDASNAGPVSTFRNLAGVEQPIPDLRSKFVIGYHENDPSFGTISATGGSNSITIDNLPSHTHESINDIKDENGNSTSLSLGDGNKAFSGAGGYNMGYGGNSYLTGNTGNNKAYYQPYYVVMFLIRFTTPLTSDVALYGRNVYHVPHRLGIGTTYPRGELEVAKDINRFTDDKLSTWHTDASNCQILLSGDGDDGAKDRFAIGVDHSEQNNGVNYAFLQAAHHDDDISNNIQRYYRNISLQPHGGKVGIGVTQPNQKVKLEVGGDISGGRLFVSELSTHRPDGAINLGSNTISFNNLRDVPDTAANVESVPVGGIVMWSDVNSIPQGFYVCDGGSQVWQGVNPPPNSLNEDGTARTTPYTTFTNRNLIETPIPDLRSRFVIGYDPNDPSYNALYNTGGSTTFSANNLPSHNHYSVQNHTVDGTNYYLGQYNSVTTHASGGNYIGVGIPGTSIDNAYTTSTTGQGDPYSPPYITMLFIIRVKVPLTSDTQLYGKNVYYVPHRLGVGVQEPLGCMHIAKNVNPEDVSTTTNWHTDASNSQLILSGGLGHVHKRLALGVDISANYTFLQGANHPITVGGSIVSKALSLQPKGGNVGIGTTTPETTLEVNGDICGNTLYITNLRKADTSENTTIQLGTSKISYNNLTDIPSAEQNIESVPVGGIIMWGDPNFIPAGFYICDGGEYTAGVNPTSGTTPVTSFTGAGGNTVQIPDLRSKFVIGKDPDVGAFDNIGDTGGSFQISTGNLPSHSHPIQTATDDVGNHTHLVELATNGGAHHHYMGFYHMDDNHDGGTGDSDSSNKNFPAMGDNYYAKESNFISTGFRYDDKYDQQQTVQVDQTFGHEDGAHSHGVQGDTNQSGGHHHNIQTNTDPTGSNHDYRQPFYVLMFLIRYTVPLTSDTQLYGQNVYFVPNSLGIGTTNPIPKVDVDGAVFVRNQTLTFATGGGGHSRTEEVALVFNQGSDNRTLALKTDIDASLYGTTGGGGTSATNWCLGGNTSYYFNNANVGIGASNPEQKLHIRGDDNEYVVLEFEGRRSTGTRKDRKAFIGVGATGGNWGTDMYFRIRNSDAANVTWDTNSHNVLYMNGNTTHLYTGNTERMTINSDGNVGIGTMEPEGLLDIYDVDTSHRISTSFGGYFGHIYESSSGNKWQVFFNTNNIRFMFLFNSSSRGYFQSNSDVGAIDFTGQHRGFVEDILSTEAEDYIGLIVSANKNTYYDIDYSIKTGKDAIKINESLPYVSLCKKEKDKSCYGVISDSEDGESREYSTGSFVSVSEKQYGDNRMFINSVGEGAIWVSNKNGNLESGDYITTASIPGYGQKQDSEFLANYTVAKITMDCDFQPELQYKKKVMKRNVDITGPDASGNYYDVLNNERLYTIDLKNEIIDNKNNKYTLTFDDENNLIGATQNVLDKKGQIQWEDESFMETAYNIRYVDSNGNIVTKNKYDSMIANNQEAYIAAFVGCTYHCG